MNKTKIDWADRSWNPLGQGCLHGCWYCYAKRGARRNYFMHLALYKKGKRKVPPCELCRDFLPHFHPERLNEPMRIKRPQKIFCCSTADPFAEWTKPEWREQILEVIRKCPQHIFMLLTKQPQLIDVNYKFPDNCWVGVTVTEQNEVWKIDKIRRINAKIKFVSFEPLLSHINADLRNIQWIIAGKLTGSKKVRLDKKWVNRIIKDARRKKISIFMKKNLRPQWEGTLIQEFPTYVSEKAP